MCGRFTLFDDIYEIGDYFVFNPAGITFQPRYNITPGQNVPIIVKEGNDRKCITMRWGLVPSWSNDPLIGFSMINARAETVHQKPSFKNSLKKRRCIVPTSGFYEWKKIDKKTKVPYFIKLKNSRPFGFAGLWEHWNRDGGDLTTFTIITTSPNDIMEPIHDRMPVILEKEVEGIWLDPDIKDFDKILPLLKPYPSIEMEAYEITKLVNNPQNDSPDCINPA